MKRSGPGMFCGGRQVILVATRPQWFFIVHTTRVAAPSVLPTDFDTGIDPTPADDGDVIKERSGKLSKAA
jgi:hypothetical protein